MLRATSQDSCHSLPNDKGMRIHVIAKAIEVEWDDGTHTVEAVPPIIPDAEIARHLERKRGRKVKGWRSRNV